MLIISMPFSERSLPVKPRRSHEGDQLQRIASLACFSLAFCRVSDAPFSRYSVTSGPVTLFLNFLSGQVKKALPFLRLIGGRGQGRPPIISGQTDINSTPGFSPTKRLTKELNLSFLPCQRHETPSKQEETRTFFIFTPTLNLSRANILVNI